MNYGHHKYQLEVRQSQIDVVGNNTSVVGSVHFHGLSVPQSLHQIPAPTATFKGRQEELDELTETIRESGITISDERDRQDGSGAEAGPAARRRL